jgi:hypothetical protein
MTRARDIANFLNGGGTIGGDLDISGDLDSLSGLTTQLLVIFFQQQILLLLG